MEYKKTIILLALVVFLLSIAGVSASEIGDTIASENANTIELSADNDIIEDNLQTSEENEALDSTDYDEAIAQTDTEVLGADSAKYSDLANEINQSGNIKLTHKNYTYDEGAKAIIIREDNKVIDGNGAVIDMNGSTIKAFTVTASGVTIKNLTIKNANNYMGGAIYFTKSGTVTNCNFINNTATANGGALRMISGNVSNCNFTNNKVTRDYASGGAIIFVNTGTVTNCNFTGNTANEDGGAVYFYRTGTVTNCNFTDNDAYYGGAVYIGETGTVANCNFTDNDAYYGGAVFFNREGTVANCNFTGNTANEDGGAVFFNREGTVTNCNFTGNTATDGGAISTSGDLNITDTKFEDNKAVGGTNNLALKNNARVSLNNVTPESLSPYYRVFMELANVTNITYGDVVNITLNVKDSKGNPLTDGNVSVTVNGQEYTSPVSAGEAVISIPGLNAGDYDVNVTYYKNDDYTRPSVEVAFNVAKLTSHLEIIEVINNESTYGGIITIKANVTSNNMPVTGGLLVISVNDGNYSAEVIDGTATIMLRNIDAGEYSENVTYIGTNYENQIKNVAFKVMKASAVINVTVTDITYGETAMINVNVTSNTTYVNEGSVSIAINGKAYSARVTNQMATIEIPGLAAGTYTGNVSYDSANFNSPVENITFNVLKLNTGITASAKTYVINYGGKYSITLKDEKGSLLSGQKVIFTLNGKSIGSATTNDKGVATITLTAKMLKTAKAGNRNLNINFDGTGNYNPTSKTVKITIKKEKTKIAAKKKTFKKSKKVKKYTIKLKNSKGKAVKKVKVYLKIKGKNYKAKTNSKGKATFKIKKLTKKGTYKSKITFKGNKYYSKATKKVKIKIK